MRVRTLLRFAGAWWLVPVVALFAGLAARSISSGAYAPPSTPTLQVFDQLPIAAAVIALAAALAGVRLRSSRVLQAAPARPVIRVLAPIVLTVSLSGYAAVLAVVVFAMVRSHSVGWPGFWLLVTGWSTLAAASAFGLACGVWFRTWWALPVSVAVPFVALGFPAAMYPVWLRYLVGFSGGCCQAEGDPAPAAVTAIIVFALGVAAGALIFAGASPAAHAQAGPVRHWRSHGAALLVVAVTGGLSVPFAQQVEALPGSMPIVPRAAERVCEGTSPRLCLWPEHLTGSATFATDARDIVGIQRRFDLPATSLFVDYGVDGGASLASGGASGSMLLMPMVPGTSIDRRIEQESAALAGTPGCSSSAASAVFQQSDWARLQLIAQLWWAQRLADAHQVPLPGSITDDPASLHAAQTLDRMTPSGQGAWVASVTRAIVSCQAPTVRRLS